MGLKNSIIIMVSVIASVAVMVFFFCGCVRLVVEDENWFTLEYQKYGSAENIGSDLGRLMRVHNVMIDYLSGRRNDLDIPAVVNGKERQFFNEREKSHMVDVRNMYLFINGLMPRFALMGIAACVIIRKLKGDKIFGKVMFATNLLALLGLIALGTAAMADFNALFIRFHQISFSNDLWILDPKTDLLINILPEGIFMDMAVRIILIFGALLALFTAALGYKLKKQKTPAYSRKPDKLA